MLQDAIATLREGVGAIEQMNIDRMCAALAALRPLHSYIDSVAGVGDVRGFDT